MNNLDEMRKSGLYDRSDFICSIDGKSHLLDPMNDCSDLLGLNEYSYTRDINDTLFENNGYMNYHVSLDFRSRFNKLIKVNNEYIL